MKRYGDLSKSVYCRNIYPNVTLYFSSFRNIEKFNAQRKSSQEEMRNLFRVRYGVPVNVDLLADMALYVKIEKVGFCVKLDEEIVRCPDELVLNGDRLMINGCLTQSEILTQKLEYY